jgi:hypothetical protein
MTSTMTEQPAAPASPGPAEERRGGVAPDWGNTRPGEELPALDDPERYPPPGTDQVNGR